MTNQISLYELLAELRSETICLLNADAVLTIGMLRERARLLRSNFPQLRGHRIALSNLSPLELIETIIAFDGVVASMLLIPSSISEDVKQKIIKSANCEYLFNKFEKVECINKTASSLKNHETSWQLATSGTTGTPKVINHTFKSLTRSVKYQSEQGTLFVWGLMYDPCRFAGLQVVLQALLGGSQLILPKNNSFKEQVKVLLQNNVNALSATPSLWRKLLMDGQILNLNLKQITLGGEIVDQSLIDSLSKYFPNSRIVHIYASTEAGTGFSVKDKRAGFPSEWIDNDAAPVALKISANNTLLIKPIEMPDGKEITIRKNTEGYLDTQDLVKLDSDRIYFCGRESGVINVGGNKVHPEEIENFIREIAGVFNVRVFAKKNSIMGQLVAAEVVCNKNEDENIFRKIIQKHCRENLELWQCPTILTFVDEIETTNAGKTVRSVS